jgi:hypothetical protein
MFNKIYTMTAKSAPSRFLSQKAGTQPPHIAGLLAQIFQYVMIMSSRRI